MGIQRHLVKTFYAVKPAIPRRLQISMRRSYVRLTAGRHRISWPINEKASGQPEGWTGWPHHKKFALVLTHDVEGPKGEDRCLELMDFEISAGVRSGFYFVPGRARRSDEVFPPLKRNGFEIGVHGLFHDGRLFSSPSTFRRGAGLINHFLAKWGAVGFRGDSMHHKLDWMHSLHILYDASTFDVDPFEPQPDGVNTIFPFHVECPLSGAKFVEIPYTLPQDFTLFVVMRERAIDIWKRKLDWIAARGGMALVITHPDYMNWKGRGAPGGEYPADFYKGFLAYVSQKYGGVFWNALPSEIARHWNLPRSGEGKD
ncbi:MAG: hypothetical protein PHX45_08575 [Acidobacteriota bacterium]|nr:hypothetical protein [Acidobacteriota bacterium]